MNLCAYADETKVKPIAIVVPQENFLNQLGFDSNTAYDDRKLVSKFVNSLNATGKAQGLNGIELLQSIVLVHDEWTPENGFVSSAQKLQRKKILKTYETQVKKAYGDS